MKHKLGMIIFASVLAVATSGCGEAASGSDDQELTSASLRLDYYFNGYNVPFAAGVAEGFYEDEGIDLSIGEGKSSATTIKTVQSGQDDFGIGGVNTILAAVTNESVPIKSVGTYVQQSPLGFVWHDGHPVESATDFIGREFFIQPGFSGNALLPLVYENVGVDSSEVTTVTVDPAAGNTKFLQTPNAVSLLFRNGDYLRIKEMDEGAQFTPLSDFDVNILATSLFTNTDLIEEDPELVEKFMRATERSWEWAAENPTKAVEAAMTVFPDAEQEIIQAGFEATLDLTHLSSSEGKAFGWVAEEEWENTAEVLYRVDELENEPLPVDVYFTNEFISSED